MPRVLRVQAPRFQTHELLSERGGCRSSFLQKLSQAKAAQCKQHYDEHNDSIRQMESSRQRQLSASGAVVESLERRKEKSGNKNAGEHSNHNHQSIDASGDRRDARCPWAESADGETDSENDSTNELRQNESFRHINSRDVENAQP